MLDYMPPPQQEIIEFANKNGYDEATTTPHLCPTWFKNYDCVYIANKKNNLSDYTFIFIKNKKMSLATKEEAEEFTKFYLNYTK